MRPLMGIAIVVGSLLGSASVGSAQDELIATWDEVMPTPKPDRVGKWFKRSAMTLTFEGTAAIWKEKDGGMVRQSLFVPVKTDKHAGIDFMTVSSGKFWTTRALYKIDGDTLTIKESALEDPRPTDLVADDLSATTVLFTSFHVYKRRGLPK